MFYGFTTQYPSNPTPGATQSPPEGASFQQRQMLEQAQRRLQSSAPGTPVYERNKKYYEDFLKSFQTHAPTRPTIGGRPTSGDLRSQIEYEKELNQWRQQQQRFSGEPRFALGSDPALENQAAVLESQRQGAQFQNLVAGERAARAAEREATAISQGLSGPYARQQNQVAAAREDYNAIQRRLASLSPGEWVPSPEKRQRLIAEARRRAEAEYGPAIEQIKQSYASRGMYGSSAMNDEIAKATDRFSQHYISQAEAEFERENAMGMQRYRQEKNLLESEMNKYIRMFNEYSRSGAATPPPGYDQIVNQLYQQYQQPAIDWSQFSYNPYYGGE